MPTAKRIRYFRWYPFKTEISISLFFVDRGRILSRKQKKDNTHLLFFSSGDPGGTDTLKAEQRQKHTQTACYNNNGNNAIDAGIESCFMNSAENTTGLNAAEPAVNRCCYMCKLPPKSLHNVVYKIIFILRQLYDLYRSVHTPRTPHTHTCAREYTLARTSAGVRTHTRTHARTHTHTHTLHCRGTKCLKDLTTE